MFHTTYRFTTTTTTTAAAAAATAVLHLQLLVLQLLLLLYLSYNSVMPLQGLLHKTLPRVVYTPKNEQIHSVFIAVIIGKSRTWFYFV